MPRTLVKRELTLATYFLKQDWLLKEFFYRLFLRAPLPQTSFLFPFPSSYCPVFVPWITVLRFLCLFLSVLLLFPLLHSCMCTEIQHICADYSLSSQFTRVMITLPFTSFLFLHVFMEFLPQPHLTDHMSNQQSARNIRVSGTYCWWFNLWKIKSLCLFHFFQHRFSSSLPATAPHPPLVARLVVACLLCMHRTDLWPHVLTERAWRCCSWLCIFLSSCSKCWQRAAQPAPPVQGLDPG